MHCVVLLEVQRFAGRTTARRSGAIVHSNTPDNPTPALPPPCTQIRSKSTSYFWATVDIMGRLEMMAPYLAAHPHVKVHVPPIFLAAWEPNHPAMIWSTAAGFGDRRRFVTGRILARVAHLPDRAQSGKTVMRRRARSCELSCLACVSFHAT